MTALMRKPASQVIVSMFLAVVVVVAAFMYRPSGGKTAAQVLGDTIVRTASGGNGNGNSGNGNANGNGHGNAYGRYKNR